MFGKTRCRTVFRRGDRSGLKRFAVVRALICCRSGPAWTPLRRGAALEDPGPRSIALTGPSAIYSVGRGAASGNVCGFSCPVRSPGAVPPPDRSDWCSVGGPIRCACGSMGFSCTKATCSTPVVLASAPLLATGAAVGLVLELRSPCHDDGALITSDVVREPLTAADDPEQLLLPEALDLALSSLDALPENWLVLDPDSSQATEAVSDFLSSRPAAAGEVRGLVMPTSTWPGSGLWRTPGRRQNAPSGQLLISWSASLPCGLPIRRRRCTPGWSAFARRCGRACRPPATRGDGSRSMGRGWKAIVC